MGGLLGFCIQHKSPIKFRLYSMSTNGFRKEQTFIKGDNVEIEQMVIEWSENHTGKPCSIIGEINIPGYGQTIIVKVN